MTTAKDLIQVCSEAAVSQVPPSILDEFGEWVTAQGGPVVLRATHPDRVGDEGLVELSYEEADGTELTEVWRVEGEELVLEEKDGSVGGLNTLEMNLPAETHLTDEPLKYTVSRQVWEQAFDKTWKAWEAEGSKTDVGDEALGEADGGEVRIKDGTTVKEFLKASGKGDFDVEGEFYSLDIDAVQGDEAGEESAWWADVNFTMDPDVFEDDDVGDALQEALKELLSRVFPDVVPGKETYEYSVAAVGKTWDEVVEEVQEKLKKLGIELG